jgi:hypothetical protein
MSTQPIDDETGDGSWGFALSTAMLQEYLTTEDAAQFLKMGESTLEQLRTKGGGPNF